MGLFTNLNLQTLLRPDKDKILNTVIMLPVGIVCLIVLYLLLSIPFSIFWGNNTLYNSSPCLWHLLNFILNLPSAALNVGLMFYFDYNPILGLLCLLLLSYLSGCYIKEKRSWSNGIFVYIICYILWFGGTALVVNGHNSLFAKSCVSSADCHYIGDGSFNKNYLPINNKPFLFGFCSECAAICRNNKCETLIVTGALSVADQAPKSLDDCELINDEYGHKEECYLLMAGKFNDTKICDKVKTEYYRQGCYAGIASTNPKNIDICATLNTTDAVDSCYQRANEGLADTKICDKITNEDRRNRCYSDAGIGNGNLTICIKLSNPFKDDCYKGIAEKVGGITLCNTISDLNTKIECVGSFDLFSGTIRGIADIGSPGGCAGISDSSFRDACYLWFAKKTKDANLCAKINYAKYYSLCYQNVALETGDIQACEKTDNQTIKDLCLWAVGEKNSDSSYCGQVKNDEFRSLCYNSLDVSQIDENYCNQISNNLEKAYCWVKLAQKLKDDKICEKILSPQYITDELQTARDSCFSEVAKVKKDQTLCEIVRLPEYKDNCYRFVGEATNDISICEKISDFMSPTKGFSKDPRTDCFNTVAFALNDTSICSRIRLRVDKASCLLELGEKLKDTSICAKIEIQPEKDICNREVNAKQ